MNEEIKRIILKEVFETYDSDYHSDDYENLRIRLENAGVEDAWERNIDADLKSVLSEILQANETTE